MKRGYKIFARMTLGIALGLLLLHLLQGTAAAQGPYSCSYFGGWGYYSCFYSYGGGVGYGGSLNSGAGGSGNSGPIYYIPEGQQNSGEPTRPIATNTVGSTPSGTQGGGGFSSDSVFAGGGNFGNGIPGGGAYGGDYYNGGNFGNVYPGGGVYPGEGVYSGSNMSRHTCYHVVRRGENLYRIGLRYGVSWGYLAQLNGLPNGNYIYAGQLLRVPGC